MCFQELYSNVHSLVFIYTKLNHLIRSPLHEHNYETRLTMKILHIIKKKQITHCHCHSNKLHRQKLR